MTNSSSFLLPSSSPIKKKSVGLHGHDQSTSKTKKVRPCPWHGNSFVCTRSTAAFSIFLSLPFLLSLSASLFFPLGSFRSPSSLFLRSLSLSLPFISPYKVRWATATLLLSLSRGRAVAVLCLASFSLQEHSFALVFVPASFDSKESLFFSVVDKD